MVLVLALISMSIFLSYTLGVCIAFKRIPSSISDTFYKLEEVHKNLGSLFTLFCFGVAFTLLPVLFELTKTDVKIVGLLAAAGLLLVGAAPYFKGYDRDAHFIGAYGCIIFSQLWSALLDWRIPLICWSVYMLCTAIYMFTHRTGNLEKTFLRAKPMFWVEVTAFATVFITILIEL